MATRCGAALWVLAAVGYLALEALSAANFGSSYSYTRNYISDVGVDAGSAWSRLIHIAFYLQGVLFFAGGLLIVGVPGNPRARVFLGLLAANAIGNIVIGTVPSGGVHRTGAALAIVGGNLAILTGSAVAATISGWRWYRHISNLFAALGLLSLLMLIASSATSTTQLLPDGAAERASVYSILAWQLLTAACLLSIPRRAAPDTG